MTAYHRTQSFIDSYRPRWTALKQIGKTIFIDYAIAFERDPAARNWLEVLLCYPGTQAMLFYRLDISVL